MPEEPLRAARVRLAEKRRDAAMRLAAFDHVRRLTARDGVLDSSTIAAGFSYQGDRVPLINPQRGIFKPRGLPFLLSIRTVIPRAGARLWYDDQTQAHRQIYEGDEVLDYAFMGKDPAAPENQWLREAMERQVPVIYFLGVVAGTLPSGPADVHRRVVPAVADGEESRSGRPGPPTSRPLPPRRPSAAMRSAKSSSACTRPRSARACSPPTGTAARSATCRDIG